MFKLLERLIYPLFILTAVVGLVYWYWTTTPAYALTQIVAAVKNKDAEKFERYVDIENITYHAVDDLLHGPARESGMFGHFDNMIGVGIISLFKPEIAEIARTHLLNFIKAGTLNASLSSEQSAPALATAAASPPAAALAKDALAADTPAARALPPAEANNNQLSSLFGRAAASHHDKSGDSAVERFTKNIKVQQQLKEYGLSKNGFKGVDYLKVDGTTALVGLKFHSDKLQRNFIIELKMEDSGGYWRITELSNLNDLVSTYLELREQLKTPSQSRLLGSPTEAALALTARR